MLRKNNFSPKNYYHIYNRGTDKRKVFLDESDYSRFLFLLYVCNNNQPVNIRESFPQIHKGRSFGDSLEIFAREKTLVNIGAYCLMPNHFHLLIREKENGGISNFMKKISTAYAMYFNKRHKRNGNLFQGRFKAELADNDNYLKYLFAYIHLNPIKLIESDWKEKGIKDFKSATEFIENYQWSSYLFYIKRKQKDSILDAEEFPRYFNDFNEFQNFINEWLNPPKDRPLGSL